MQHIEMKGGIEPHPFLPYCYWDLHSVGANLISVFSQFLHSFYIETQSGNQPSLKHNDGQP